MVSLRGPESTGAGCARSPSRKLGDQAAFDGYLQRVEMADEHIRLMEAEALRHRRE